MNTILEMMHKDAQVCNKRLRAEVMRNNGVWYGDMPPVRHSRKTWATKLRSMSGPVSSVTVAEAFSISQHRAAEVIRVQRGKGVLREIGSKGPLKIYEVVK